MTNDLKRLIRQRSKVFSRWRKTDDARCKIKYNKLRNLIQRKICVAKSTTEIPSWRNLTPFPQENLSIGNLSTVTGIRANPATSQLSLMVKQFMIPMKSVTFLTPIFLAFQRYPMKNSEMKISQTFRLSQINLYSHWLSNRSMCILCCQI